MALYEVSKDEFFRFMMKQKIDIHPAPERDRTFWNVQGSRRVAGTSPGYMHPSASGPYYLETEVGDHACLRQQP